MPTFGSGRRPGWPSIPESRRLARGLAERKKAHRGETENAESVKEEIRKDGASGASALRWSTIRFLAENPNDEGSGSIQGQSPKTPLRVSLGCYPLLQVRPAHRLRD